MVETNDKQHGVKQEEEYDDDGIKLGLSCTDHAGAKRCVITGMGNAWSLYCDESALKQDEPIEEQKGSGRMKQSLLWKHEELCLRSCRQRPRGRRPRCG